MIDTARNPSAPEAVNTESALHGDVLAHAAVDRLDLLRVVFVGAAAALVWLRIWEPFSAFSLIGVAATLIGGYPIFKEAFKSILERRMTMELSMTIALVAALAIRQAFTALVITEFVLIAEILEHLTVSRGRDAIGDLLRFLPQTAHVRRGGRISEVPTEALRFGDEVLVNPGSLVPIDGVVTAGHSFVDEARITGESLPAEKTSGSVVYAGTLNQNGTLDVETRRVGRDTSFGRIIEAVERAERAQAPIERLADRLSAYVVYFALGAATLTFLVTRNIVATISVVIVAGACGIAAGTPLAVLGAIGRAAKAGAIVKGGRYLEALAAVDTVIFDKTGTLTGGAPVVSQVLPAEGVGETSLLRAAAIAEARSEHPIGRAIVAYASAHNIAVSESETFDYTPGRGIRATYQGETILVGTTALLAEHSIATRGEASYNDVTDVVVARGREFLGRILVTDAPRPEAAQAIADLRALAIRTVVLTGDGARVAEAVAEQLQLDDVVAELLPEEKAEYVARLVGAGHIVAMVGDGINDAPALMRATVGVAMGSGTDVARESANVVLIGNDLSRFVETVKIARRTKAIVMQNFVGTIGVDAVGMALAAVGIVNPVAAAFIHVTSELAFILNSARMLAPAKPPPSGT